MKWMAKPKIFTITVHLGFVLDGEEAYKKPREAIEFPFRKCTKRKVNSFSKQAIAIKHSKWGFKKKVSSFSSFWTLLFYNKVKSYSNLNFKHFGTKNRLEIIRFDASLL